MIYAALRLSDGSIKIGTSDNPHQRAKDLGKTHRLIAVWDGGYPEEHLAHVELRHWNVNQGWTQIGRWGGDREWFRPVPAVLRYIQREAIFVLKHDKRKYPDRSIAKWLREVVEAALPPAKKPRK